MNFDTKDNPPGHICAGTAVCIENEPLLVERLQAFGLIESDDKGGWRLTACCQASLAASAGCTEAPKPETAVIRPWKPRTLVWSAIG